MEPTPESEEEYEEDEEEYEPPVTKFSLSQFEALSQDEQDKIVGRVMSMLDVDSSTAIEMIREELPSEPTQETPTESVEAEDEPTRSEQMWPSLEGWSTQYSRNIGFYIPGPIVVDNFWTTKAHQMSPEHSRSILVCTPVPRESQFSQTLGNRIAGIFQDDILICLAQVPAFGRAEECDYMKGHEYYLLAESFVRANKPSLWIRGIDYVLLAVHDLVYVLTVAAVTQDQLANRFDSREPSWGEFNKWIRDSFLREALDMVHNALRQFKPLFKAVTGEDYFW